MTKAYLKGAKEEGIAILPFVTRFAKTRHNDACLEIQIVASVSFMYLKLCSVAISMLYC